MTTLSILATAFAAAMGIFMTFVSWRVLKHCPILDNPIIHVLVGTLTFIGFRYRPGGMVGTICLGYEAVAISILFLLLVSVVARKRMPDSGRESRQESDVQQDHDSLGREEKPGNIQRSEPMTRRKERQQ